MRAFAFLALLFVVAANAHAAEISGVPFLKQETLQCGPAALSSVFSFYGAPMDQADIGKAVYSEKLKGTLVSDLENFARARGFKTTLGQGTIETLKGFVDAGKPVIVPVDLGFWLVSKPHYLLVFGYGESGFIAHSGDEASELYNYSTFQRLWDKTGRTFLVVFP